MTSLPCFFAGESRLVTKATTERPMLCNSNVTTFPHSFDNLSGPETVS